MNRQTARFVALATPAVTVPLCIAGFTFGLQRRAAVGDVEPFGFGEAGFFVSQLAFTLVGVLIVLRRPDYPIGGLFCFIAVVASFSTAAGQYVLADYTGIVDLDGTAEVVWVGTVVGSFIPVAFITIIMIFPPATCFRLDGDGSVGRC